MNKILIIILLGMLCWGNVAYTQTTDALDKQNGFFGITFGANLDTLKGFRYKNRYMKKDLFVNDSLPMEYAGVKFSHVSFIFFKKMLHSVILRTEGAEQSQALLQLLELYYGAGVQDGMGPQFVWDGKKVNMVYDQNLLTKNAELVIESKIIQNMFARDYQVRFGE